MHFCRIKPVISDKTRWKKVSLFPVPHFLMKHGLTYAVVLYCCLVLFSSCGKRQDDTPVRIGIAWRGDDTAITYTSTLQSVREAGAIPVPLPLLKSPFMEYEGDQLLAQYTDEHGIASL